MMLVRGAVPVACPMALAFLLGAALLRIGEELAHACCDLLVAFAGGVELDEGCARA